jgi:hypothetical protein
MGGSCGCWSAAQNRAHNLHRNTVLHRNAQNLHRNAKTCTERPKPAQKRPCGTETVATLPIQGAPQKSPLIVQGRRLRTPSASAGQATNSTSFRRAVWQGLTSSVAWRSFAHLLLGAVARHGLNYIYGSRAGGPYAFPFALLHSWSKMKRRRAWSGWRFGQALGLPGDRVGGSPPHELHGP